MNKCIYCNKHNANSKEHYLPKALGNFKNFELLKDRICSKCNGKFSALEGQFCGPTPEGMFRQILGIRGRKRSKKKSPFYDKYSGVGPMKMVGANQPKDYPILWQIIPGQKGIQEASQIVFIDERRKPHQILLNKEMTGTELRHIVKQKGLNKCDSATFYYGEEEKEWVEKLLLEFSPTIKLEYKGKGQVGRKIKTQTVCEVNDAYFRAGAKIGFHYFLKQFPHVKGTEPEFSGIKKFIQKGGNWDPFVRISRDQIMPEFRKGIRLINYGHILHAKRGTDGCKVWAQFFVGPDYLSNVWEINLSKERSPIYFEESKAHLFLYYEQDKRRTFHGLMEEIAVFPKLYQTIYWGNI